MTAVLAGCTSLGDANLPEPIRPFQDPELGRPYLFYRPSAYDRDKNWPLIVLCSSTFPDSPKQMIRQWAEVAESRGMLLLAPTLAATTSTFAPKAVEQLPLQREDERHLLAALQHVRGGHSVSDDRIFLHGSGSGAVSALYTALRHSELFRAIDLSNPKFHSICLGEVADHIDPFQPVRLDFKITDKILGSHGKKCEDWLRDNGADVQVAPPGSGEPGDPLSAVRFFEDIIRGQPWIHIRSTAPDPKKPREFKFSLDCSFTPSTYAWEFGDGQVSPVARPLHHYLQPGTYPVTVTLTGPKGATHRRLKSIVVP